MIYDHCVIGGGIVGMASAMALVRRRPGSTVLVLEKETDIARHQTGHNSGVIHSGIYYEPGSLKAELSRRGAEATKEFCAEHGLPMTVQGKLLVASDDRDARRLDALVDRAAANRIEARRISAAELRELEPEVAGVGALLVPATGSVDYVAITRAMRDTVEREGGQVEVGQAVTGIAEGADSVAVTTEGTTWRARRLVVCGGLQADRLAALAGLTSAARIVPFRGEYYQLPPERSGIVTRLIYPVPDPALPFLGVHLTPMVDGRVTVGPNAVLGLSREGYRKGSVDRRDVRDIVSFPGFWRLARHQVRTGAVEMRNSMFKRGYLAAARRYCPGLQLEDLLPYEAGIRAQAVLRDGTMVHDFLLEETARTLHVLNAPSPAATSAIPIGELIADKALAAA
ncbi:L-2-hydroxyglutarate oxidase [Blastococcus colisei]|uniref:L-2-hydroxyglutarate oxidase n=1 Tax=Blastococcus colisei TaxID=1564162 RepID=A0A543PBQ2_9ACTN|nr:L-2-hydroxyglutarate oxidase [Blastococcus colisei]TQN41516.1 L-2-hydroxyglutarate oxidase [Blastococcus colisei]